MPIKKRDVSKVTSFLTDTDIDSRIDKTDYSRNAEEFMERVGFPIKTRPERLYEFPMDITVLGLDDISKLLCDISRTMEYMFTEVAKMDIRYNDAKKIYKNTKSMRLISVSCQEFGRASEDRRCFSESSVDVLEAERNLSEAEAIYKLGRAALDGASKNYDSVSRELTRRLKEMDIAFSNRGVQKTAFKK